MKRHPFSQQGQGLIETLAVFLFVSISIVALIQFQHYLSYSTNVTQQQADAILAATNQIEILRNYSVITPQTGYIDYQSIVSGTGTSNLNNTTYNLTWTVTTATNYKTLDITVTWTDRQNVNQSVRLVTQVSQTDPALSAAIM